MAFTILKNSKNAMEVKSSFEVAGQSFVVIAREEYERLTSLAAELPTLPPADGVGNRPAVEFAQVAIARGIIADRKALGLSQQELAKLAGVRQETLSRIESGKVAPNVRTIEKIERALQRRQGSQKRRK